ncbi:MAG: RluA family pseudouridine synthase [Candidatus Daviesbacteria bacterium]|nr:MAG: RluA family pseudouridine synthase [Candidatus Daviesbacteria bacterium]
MSLPVVFEDEFLLVVDKPPGLVTTPGETVKSKSLAQILQADFGIDLERGGLVHRLDKDTSGLILVAKNAQILASLQNQFKSRQVKKQYLALVHGSLNETRIVEGSIARNPGNREKFTVLAEGKEAKTEVEPLKQLTMDSEQLTEIFSDFNKIQMRKLSNLHYSKFTLTSCRPLTGRTHQIRVHLKYIGFPIVADQKYGGRKMNRLDNRWCPRMFLHAHKLEFTHPVNREWIKLETELPKDLKKVLNLLELKA